MSDLLLKGLASTKRELEAGLADAEAELAKTEEYSRKLEELIAVGRATLHAASQTNLQGAAPARAAESRSATASNGQEAQKPLVREAQS